MTRREFFSAELLFGHKYKIIKMCSVTEKAQEVILRYCQAWQGNDLEKILDLYHPELSYHDFFNSRVLRYPDMPVFVKLSMLYLLCDNLEYIDRIRVDEDVAFIQYHAKLPLMGSGRYALFRVGEAITIKNNLIWSVLKYSTIVRNLPEAAKENHKLGLDDRQVHRLLSDLRQYFMVSERFLDPEYCLTKMALDTGYSRNQLSFALNQKLGLSFYQYINRHRIDWVVNELKKNSGQSPAKISLCAGFNSLSVFYRCFRSRLGMTPREYVATLENGCDGAVIPDSSVSDK